MLEAVNIKNNYYWHEKNEIMYIKFDAGFLLVFQRVLPEKPYAFLGITWVSESSHLGNIHTIFNQSINQYTLI